MDYGCLDHDGVEGAPPSPDPSPPRTRVLVTGGAGFIGSHLIDRLLDRGHDVVGLDCFDDFYDPAIKEENLRYARCHDRFEEVRADIRDPAAYEQIPEGIELVVHLAALAGVRPSIRNPQRYVDVNLGGTQRLLDFMGSRGISRLLFGSSSSVYGNDSRAPFAEDAASDRPISPYAATKRAGEILVHAHAHLSATHALCLRFFTVFGPRQRPDLAIHKFSRLMGADAPIPVYGDGSSERDYTYVDDIVDGIESAITHLFERPGTFDIVNLGSGRTIQLRDMVTQLAHAMGVAPRIRRMSDQPGDVRRTLADVGKAEKLLGYRPSVPFDLGVRRFVDWMRTEHRSTPSLVWA